MSEKIKRKGGFTLVEILIVVAIIAILAAIIIPSSGAVIDSARKTSVRAGAKSMITSINLAYLDKGTYTLTVDDLSAYIPSLTKVNIGNTASSGMFGEEDAGMDSAAAACGLEDGKCGISAITENDGTISFYYFQCFGNTVYYVQCSGSGIYDSTLTKVTKTSSSSSEQG